MLIPLSLFFLRQPGAGTSGSRPADLGRGFRMSWRGARGFRMSSPGARGFSRGAQGVQVNPLNPLPVAPCRPTYARYELVLRALRTYYSCSTSRIVRMAARPLARTRGGSLVLVVYVFSPAGMQPSSADRRVKIQYY